MDTHDNVFGLLGIIILLLVVLCVMTPFLKETLQSKEECMKEGNVTLCREVYTSVTRDWYLKEYK